MLPCRNIIIIYYFQWHKMRYFIAAKYGILRNDREIVPRVNILTNYHTYTLPWTSLQYHNNVRLKFMFGPWRQSSGKNREGTHLQLAWLEVTSQGNHATRKRPSLQPDRW